ncbi:NAD(P)H dehydrogenase (quinone) [Vigna angularis]|uniref:NAD(P)H dehydrogenase (quinone) n=1 Tax=Phaseolus angularis TaxID=3914 RepID=A0A8T0KCQ9_PHAAN|nr:NAD(P)H dehydrogenase (quinone) [Vigna angularis]
MDGMLCNNEEPSRKSDVDLFAEMGVEVTVDDFVAFTGTGISPGFRFPFSELHTSICTVISEYVLIQRPPVNTAPAVPETLSAEERIDLRAPPKNEVPVVNQIKLPEADGFIFGFPERFGMMASQFKAFHDSTQFLWKGQMLASKPAGIFYATSSQGGGQETAA